LWVIPHTAIVHLLPVNLRKSIKPNLHISREFHPMEEIRGVSDCMGREGYWGKWTSVKGKIFLLAVLCVMLIWQMHLIASRAITTTAAK